MTKKFADDWSPKHIELFWDWYSSNPNLDQSYFTYQVGQGIVNFISATGLLEGNVLDFGCGTGGLLRYLLDQGLACYGAEMSPSFSDIGQQKIRRKTQLASSSGDTIIRLPRTTIMPLM